MDKMMRSNANRGVGGTVATSQLGLGLGLSLDGPSSVQAPSKDGPSTVQGPCKGRLAETLLFATNVQIRPGR